MFDSYKRHIHYLRISVTDRCNLRCKYCMPGEGVVMMRHEDILRFEEIVEVVEIAVSMGVDKVRITGGEPLVRKGIVELVRLIAAIPGIKDFGMTTNGVFLEEYAFQLKDAGLHRVNVSMDSLDPVHFREITRGGDIQQVLRGIEAAQGAGLHPVKINCVIKQSPEEADARMIKVFGDARQIQVRFIREMDLENGEFYAIHGGSGGDCRICNRLRLTANGLIKPCLFNDLEFNIRELGVKKALELAVGRKPECGTVNSLGEFFNIGG
jgi:GTP 3',8-cyclase